MSNTLPPPPQDLSIAEHVQAEWEAIILESRLGRPYGGRLKGLEQALEDRRGQIDRGELTAQYDWDTDWLVARQLHYIQLDHADWWREHRETLETFWANLARDQVSYISSVAVEGMKSTLIIHGAMALASLAVLTGQVVEPVANVRLAANIALSASVLGLSMAAIGQVLLFHFTSEATAKVQSTLASRRHLRRLYALGRYFNKYIVPRMLVVNWLIYGSVFAFVAGAIGGGIALLFAGT